VRVGVLGGLDAGSRRGRGGPVAEGRLEEGDKPVY
jgi:hypothetical protein